MLLAQPERWDLQGVVIEGGVLHPRTGTRWTEGWVHFWRPICCKNAVIVLEWSVAADRTRGEDAGSVYAKLNFTADPDRHEQLSVNATVRPSSRWYMMYLDPGWQIPNTHMLKLMPLPGQFPNASAWERFRLVLQPSPKGLKATLASRMPGEGGWVVLQTADGEAGIFLDQGADLENQQTIKALNFQFPGDFTAVRDVSLKVMPLSLAQWAAPVLHKPAPAMSLLLPPPPRKSEAARNAGKVRPGPVGAGLPSD